MSDQSFFGPRRPPLWPDRRADIMRVQQELRTVLEDWWAWVEQRPKPGAESST